jgi:hypothetical protein
VVFAVQRIYQFFWGSLKPFNSNYLPLFFYIFRKNWRICAVSLGCIGIEQFIRILRAIANAKDTPDHREVYNTTIWGYLDWETS